MSENDIIAEYIKEKYPMLIQSADFAIYKLICRARNAVNSFCDAVRGVDWEKVNEFAEMVEDNKK